MDLCLFWMDLILQRQLFPLRDDESVFCKGFKGSFSILGNAFSDASLYPFFPWCNTKDMLHFPCPPCKKNAFMNVQTVVTYGKMPRVCQRRKGCLSSLFILVCLHLDVLSTCIFTERDFEGFGVGEDAGHALPCSQPQVWHASRWVLLRWNFFGLKCTLKVNTATAS